MSPTSTKMKNTFVYNLASVTPVTINSKKSRSRNLLNQSSSSSFTQISQEKTPAEGNSTVRFQKTFERIVVNKRPAARDGHSCVLVPHLSNHIMIVFGGDRH